MKKINVDVFYRFEPNLGNNGELIVYLKSSGALYEMTEPYYIFLKEIDKGYTFESLLNAYMCKYPTLTKEEIISCIETIEKELYELGLIL